MRRELSLLTAGMLVLGSLSCASMSKSEKGAVIGASGGAAVGGAIGSQSGNTVVGAIIGAAIGGAAGAIIGDYMDQQAEEIEQDLEGATVERIGEGIKITFDSGLLFDVDKEDLQPTAMENLTNLAVILNKYDDTNILIEGHTDSDGSETYNQRLSERRAQSVSAFLAVQEVSTPRISKMGYGESQPVADNNVSEGKRLNRRVEVAIMANDDLKKAAKEKVED